MAIIKSKKLREMDEKEIDQKLKEIKLELSKDRASSEIGTVKNPGRIREMRRTIAKILHEKQKRNINARRKPAAKQAAAKMPAKK